MWSARWVPELGVRIAVARDNSARRRAEANGYAIDFQKADAENLPFAEAAFDVVLSTFGVMFTPDQDRAASEMARVCRPGGVIAVRDVDYSALGWFPADDGLDRWLDLYQRVHRRNGSEPDAGRRLLSWAHAAGLRDVTATTSSWCFAAPGEREWWGNSWAGRATASSFAEQAVAYGLATTAELDEIAAAWLRWRDADDGWLGMLHGELLIRI
jgi:SAM-dependent methyltransferase